MQKPLEKFPRANNLDLLRLFAAMQVVFIHSFEHLYHLGSTQSNVLQFLNFIPGVPLFFFLSGLLISQSFDRSSSLSAFAKNRLLRLFPALWTCTLLSIAILVISGYMNLGDLFLPQVFAWFVTQSTFLQFFNPDFFDGFGTGVVNGSLWTISIEFQFYLLMPFLAALFRYRKTYIAFFLVSVIANIALNQLNLRETLAGKLLGSSFLPWVYMFMVGQLVYLNWYRIRPIIANKSILLFSVFLAFTALSMLAENYFGIIVSGNAVLPPSFLLIAALALSLSIYKPEISSKYLKGNDISYGIYIYHMPIINLFLFYSLVPTWSAFSLLLTTIIITSILSWRLIERPALRLKSYSIRPR